MANLLGRMAGAEGNALAEMRAYEPTFRDRLAVMLLNAGLPEHTVEGLMGSRGLGPTQRNAGIGLVDFTPAGIPLAVNEAQRSGQEGDWLGATMNAAAVIPGAKAGTKALEAGINEVKQGLRGFHGSPETALRTISANPPKRQYDNATSQFGAFLAPNEGVAKRYAGETGRIYSVEAPVSRPYEMSWKEFDYFQSPNKAKDGSSAGDWTARADELKQEAIELRQRLAAEGYDGIIVRGGRNNDIKEIAAFNDVPVPGIRAYHGSPHDFDRFSTDKIGTGEGAQAYGHGLYFAENEAVAKEYRRALARPTPDAPAWRLNGEPVAAGTDHYRLAGILEQSPPKPGEPVADYVKRRAAELDDQAVFAEKAYGPDTAIMYRLKAEELRRTDASKLTRHDPGKTYEVSINAHPDEFLDWDKPLSEQPKAVQEALAQYGDNGDGTLSSHVQTALQDAADETHPNFNQTGSDLIDRLNYAADESGQSVSNALRAAGIKGIRYKDAGSRAPLTQLQADYDKLVMRGAPEAERQAAWEALDAAKTKGGTSNYVVFDDKIIDILKKYGIAGLTAGGVAGMAAGTPTDARAGE